MRTRILRIDADKPQKEKIAQAATAIRKGKVVVFPTETVYGIGANALDARACREIFRVKGREGDNPLIVHVSDMEMACGIGRIDGRNRKILARVWPAPLTVVVKSTGKVPRSVTGGLDTIAIRMPDNKVALELIGKAGVPIAAPSANPSKMPSSTAFRHALRYFKGKVDVIIGSKDSRLGLESTVLDLRTFAILRPGVFTKRDIETAFGRKARVDAVTKGEKGVTKAISPGTKYRHYAPSTPLFMYTGRKSALTGILSGIRTRYAFIGTDEACSMLPIGKGRKIQLGRRRDMGDIARNLFDALIRVDSIGADFAVVESFSDSGIGLAIMNRLRKASSHSGFSDAKGLLILLKRYGIGAHEDNKVQSSH
ncbi:MAG: threonylcarbamoyl-AMP synthase [Candidatus Micrarchaeota archaeon]|nr:threonylcarbamoyl-AMP synthase [Candidatus Micrarchaeota archaeon]